MEPLDLNRGTVARSGCPMVARSDRATSGETGNQPDLSDDAGMSLVGGKMPLRLIGQLSGVSKQAIHKAINAGRLIAEEVPSADPRRRGQFDYYAAPEAVFAAYPQARAAWEARQAQAAASTAAVANPKATREPQELALRAHPMALERAQAVMRARLALLRKAQDLLSAIDITVSEARRLKGALPARVIQQVQGWLLTDPDAAQHLKVIGPTAPSGVTIQRWWASLREDATGQGLMPRWSAGGRPRKTDLVQNLEDLVLGAFAHSGSYATAAEHLAKQGIIVSSSTVRRILGRQESAVVKGLRLGERKAQTDAGPYVRRAPSRPFQCWSLDGHTLDTYALWDELLPGEVADPIRPHMYGVMDVGTGALIYGVIGKGLNRYLALQALAGAILCTGVIPERIQSDNGSEVINGLFQGDEDTDGYFAQLGADWSLDPIQTRALPYNSRSKPVERAFGTLCSRFSAQFPAYLGGNPSKRPGGPLSEALRDGHLETVASLKDRFIAYMQEEQRRPHRLKGRTIIPVEALAEEKDRLLRRLGPEHPRFVRPGEEWRVLPSLKGRQVRGAVEARIEGQVLRFDAPSLHTLTVDGLQVRVNPWDVTQAWLCRGGALIEPLTWIPDGPALGAGTGTEADLVSLRIAANARRAQHQVLRRAEQARDRIRRDEGFLTGRKALPAPREVETVQGGRTLTESEKADAAELLKAMGIPSEPIPETPLAEPAPAPADASGRPTFPDDYRWAEWLLAHPDQADAGEWHQLQVFLRDNPAIALALGVTA